jgi:hypothetical protein
VQLEHLHRSFNACRQFQRAVDAFGGHTGEPDQLFGANLLAQFDIGSCALTDREHE